jgi:hypothetical protein
MNRIYLAIDTMSLLTSTYVKDIQGRWCPTLGRYGA